MRSFTRLQTSVQLVVLLPLLYSIGCAAQQRQRVIPIEDLAHLSVVQTFINGEGPFDFVFDTGAGINVLNVDLVAELGIEPVGTMEIGSPMGTEPIIADSLRIESLQLGDAIVEGLPGVAMELNELFGPLGAPDGILSAGSFDGFLVTVDFANKYVLVATGELPVADGQRVLNYSPDSRVPQIEVSIAGEPILMTIDTGSPAGVLLSDSLVATLPLLSEPVSAGQARVMDATFEIMSSQLDGDLNIGDIELKNPAFTFSDHAGHALLGMQVLKDYTLTIDSANRRLSFGQPQQVRRVEGQAAEATPGQMQRRVTSTDPASENAENRLGEYVGQYGRGSITLSGSRLHFQVDGMPTAVPMEMIAADEFEIIIPAGAQVRGAVNGEYPTIRFDRDQSGSIESLSVIDPDGSVRETSSRE